MLKILEPSQKILQLAYQGLGRVIFWKQVSYLLLGHFNAQKLIIELYSGSQGHLWQTGKQIGHTYSTYTRQDCSGLLPDELAAFHANPATSIYNSPNGAATVLAVPFNTRDLNGVFLLQMAQNSFDSKDLDAYRQLAGLIGQAAAIRNNQAALKERIKELTCISRINRLGGRNDLSENEFMQEILGIIPPSFQYPELTVTKITARGQQWQADEFEQSCMCISAPITLRNLKNGLLTVGYTANTHQGEPVEFLEEEQNLINIVADRIGLALDKFVDDSEKLELQKQLRHADRLATVGQLAAGVAHELNEPLASILGHAQLAAKVLYDPTQARQDLEKIVAASIYARDIVKKLLLFTRQMPTRKQDTDLNEVVREAMYFLEFRCRREQIDVKLNLQPGLPMLKADRSQLNQVLVNLVVNAVQAMGQGGSLYITTGQKDNQLLLQVKDTGCGMPEETASKVFLPFFTTKDVGQGTGLGLAVVHGIVTAHNGTIGVQSSPSQGTTFNLSFPLANK